MLQDWTSENTTDYHFNKASNILRDPWNSGKSAKSCEIHKNTGNIIFNAVKSHKRPPEMQRFYSCSWTMVL